MSKKVVAVAVLVWTLALASAATTWFFESAAYANDLLISKAYPLMLALGTAALSLIVGVLAVVKHWTKLLRHGWRPDSYTKLVAGLAFGLTIVTYANAASLCVFSFGVQSVIVDFTSQTEQVYRVSVLRAGHKGCPNALTWHDPFADREISFCRSVALFDETDEYVRPALVHARSGRFGLVILSVSRTS
ncbi:hypothetical protein [Burkholderia sp. THE68]|uniref:hypothetical protein n=1 Tax=Burkholderia sp. THE68 TaxID=758782 RepID=UPI001389BB12|nr:hypothetical protein [Burkholderia sp. THE68]